MNNLTRKDSKQESDCRHQFELAKVDLVAQGQGTTGTCFFYKKVAYAVCLKCGEVRQSDI